MYLTDDNTTTIGQKRRGKDIKLAFFSVLNIFSTPGQKKLTKKPFVKQNILVTLIPIIITIIT